MSCINGCMVKSNLVISLVPQFYCSAGLEQSSLSLCTAQEQAEQLQYTLAKLPEQRGGGVGAATRLYGRLNTSSTVTVQPHCRRQFHFSVGTPFELHDKKVCNKACEPNVCPHMNQVKMTQINQVSRNRLPNTGRSCQHLSWPDQGQSVKAKHCQSLKFSLLCTDTAMSQSIIGAQYSKQNMIKFFQCLTELVQIFKFL